MSELNHLYGTEMMPRLENEQLIKGKIVSIRADEVFVDIGYKSEGLIPLAELAYPIPEKAADVVVEGQILDLIVVNCNDDEGSVILSKVQADRILAWTLLESAMDEEQSISGKVTEVVKGGLVIAISGLRGFIPASQVDLRYTDYLTKYIGQNIDAIPIEVNKVAGKLVLSRRKLLKNEQEKKEEQLFSNINIGQTLKGVVTNIVDFGAFVNVGGVEGLVHISDLAWYRVAKPQEVVSIGDEVEVAGLKVDPKQKRLSLSIKQVQRDPWLDAAEDFKEGMSVNGRVVKLAKFGAFVELKRGIEGLVPLSELSEKRINNADEVVTVGQQLLLKIMQVDKNTKRISLSVNAALAERERDEYLKYIDSAPQASGYTLGDKFAHLFKSED